jgi:hypothetical protein
MEQADTHTIPENRLGLLRAGVEKLNKRADKLGMEPVVLVVGEPRLIVYQELLPAEYQEAGRIPRTVTRERWVADVSFRGTAPVIAGFAFVAKLDHQEGGNLVLRAPGIETDLSGWRQCGSRCQHCGLERRRAETFLLQHESGALLQVGRQCLKSYTGSDDVARAVKLFKLWAEFMGSMDEGGEYGCGGGWGSGASTPAEYVAAAVASIRKRGFHKSDSDRSTRNDCDFITGPCPKPDRDGGRDRIEEWHKAQPTDAQREEAAAIIAWALASKDSSDYAHNARVACAAHAMPKRTEGLLASLPVSYDKAMGREQERRERPPAGPHVGAVGDRITCKITVKLVRGYESDFGTGVMLLMADEQNSTLKTFSSGALQDQEDLSEGEWYLRGTVKKHETDQKYGHPVTLLTRCALQREPFVKAASKRKPKRASKGAPMYHYGPTGTVTEVAYGWKCPKGVPYSWDAHYEGIDIEKRTHERFGGYGSDSDRAQWLSDPLRATGSQ